MVSHHNQGDRFHDRIASIGGFCTLDDASLVKRLEDAHANCLENLPVFAALVIAASLMDKSNTIQTFAPWVLYAHIGQTLAHLWGTGPLQVFVRASCWSVQLVICLWMAIQPLAS